MRKIFLIILLFFTLGLSAQNVGILPSPQQVELQDGNFVWNAPVIFFNSKIEGADFLMDLLSQLPEVKVDRVEKEDDAKGRPMLYFQKVKSLDVPKNQSQAYMIEVTRDRIAVRAATEQGLFYGMQSLIQLYRFHYRPYFTENERVEIPCMKVVDYPALEWRGWMDDISRGPIVTLDFLKKQIRILSEYKLNCLTLYTEHTFKSSVYDYAPEGSLTPDEIRELEEYARRYYVELIGNQQCFAHMEKILRQPSFMHLADGDDNLNPALKETYTFLENVLNEEMSCYSSPFFNINCDETEQLGTGAAAKYVRKVGAGRVYAQHVSKVCAILKKKGKIPLIWADIALKDKEIRSGLPKDAQMLVWSYGPADDFRQMILPIQESESDFWVVPGVSMWSTVFPIMSSYEKNIANFARDGNLLGAKGLINTAWNDSGEALLNSAWHAFAWGAEMSWRPITATEVAEAEAERAARLAPFDTNFNFQFFHFFNNENIIADFLRRVSEYQTSNVPELYNTGSLWRFCPWQFFPGNLMKDAEDEVKSERKRLMISGQLLQLLMTEVAQMENPEILFCALQANNRMWNDVMLRKHQIDLFHYRQSGGVEGGFDSEETYAEDNESLIYWVEKLRETYNYLWDLEYRPHWRDVNNARYDALIRQLRETRSHVFFSQSLRNDTLWLRASTLFNDMGIHYTLDGSEPTENSPVFETAIPIAHSCRVRVLTTDDSIGSILGEKEIHVHLGMFAEARSEARYSIYRPEYSGGGPTALFDGETGSDSYRDGKWQGIQGQDVVINYHWEKEQNVDSVVVSYLHHYHDWILAPEDVEVYASVDGIDYQLIKRQHFDVEQVIHGGCRGKLKVEGLKLHTNFLRVIVRNPGVLPPAHGGAGSPSFLFLDEIFVY
jgi:hypothetical protein